MPLSVSHIAALAALAHGPGPGRGAKPYVAGGQARAGLGGKVAWGGQQFSNQASLAAWINSHGGNAQRTFRTHPGIGATFGQRGASAIGFPPQGGRGVSPIGRPLGVRRLPKPPVY